MDSTEYAEQYLELLIKSKKHVLESLLQKSISGENYVIEYLLEHPGPIYPSELSEKMETSTARIAAIIKHLYKSSMISRESDEYDARKHPVELSEAGLKFAAEIHKKRLELVSKVFEAIGEQETASFIKITNHMIQVCREMEFYNEKLFDQKERLA